MSRHKDIARGMLERPVGMISTEKIRPSVDFLTYALDAAYARGVAAGREEAGEAMGYIVAPTMGLQGDEDPYEVAGTLGLEDARCALQACIWTARVFLDPSIMERQNRALPSTRAHEDKP